MPKNIVEAVGVVKSFKTYENGTGILGSLRRKSFMKKALKGISLSVKESEIVALLGRNGSGKSTMIKLMSGILYPDSGSIEVLNMNPWKERTKLAMNIGVIFGSTHPQLFWDLPPLDTFIYVKEIYGIRQRDYDSRLAYLKRILSIGRVYKRQTRQLSLGERMKCEFAASMLHMPKVVFMDEPTVGVDLPSRIAISRAVIDLREKFGITFVITTHVVDDIAIADRIILLDKGKKLFDGKQEELKKRFGKYAILEIYFKPEAKVDYAKYGALGEVFSKKDGYIGLKVDPNITKSDAFTSIFKDDGIEDYRLSEPGLSSILESTYKRIDSNKRPEK
ncbi:MAG: ATP-binding cassette domain-containing protein [Methanothrix sp.]